MTRTSDDVFNKILRDFYVLLFLVNSGYNDPFKPRFSKTAPRLIKKLLERLSIYSGSYNDNLLARQALKSALDELDSAFTAEDFPRTMRVVLAFTRNENVRIETNEQMLRDFMLLLCSLNLIGFTSKEPPCDKIQPYLKKVNQTRGSCHPDDKLLTELLETAYTELLELGRTDERNFWIFVSALTRSFSITIPV